MPSAAVVAGTTLLTGGTLSGAVLAAGGVGTDGTGVVSAAEGGAGVGNAEAGRGLPGISCGAGNSGADRPVAGARAGFAFGAAAFAGAVGDIS